MNDDVLNTLFYIAIGLGGMAMLLPGISTLYCICIVLVAMMGIYFSNNTSYSKVEFNDLVMNTGKALVVGWAFAVIIYIVVFGTAVGNIFK